MRERRPKGFGSVRARKRGDGTIAFMLKVTLDGQDYVRTVPAASKKEAMAMLPAFVADVQNGEAARKKAEAKRLLEQPTVAVFSEIFLASHVSQDPDRAATRTAYANMLCLYLLPKLGDCRLAEVTQAKLREALQEQFKQGRALGTIRLAHAVAHRLFDAAVDDGYLKENPTPKFKKLHLGKSQTASEGAKRHSLTDAQLASLYICHALRRLAPRRSERPSLAGYMSCPRFG